jgi:hypothetical protein
MLTVPAHQFLWSHFDEARHCRRYSASIRKSLVETGFEVEFLSQFMACIFPIVWVFRKIGGLFQNSSFDGRRKLVAKEFRLVPVVNEVLASLLHANRHFLGRRGAKGFVAAPGIWRLEGGRDKLPFPGADEAEG